MRHYPRQTSSHRPLTTFYNNSNNGLFVLLRLRVPYAIIYNKSNENILLQEDLYAECAVKKDTHIYKLIYGLAFINNLAPDVCISIITN